MAKEVGFTFMRIGAECTEEEAAANLDKLIEAGIAPPLPPIFEKFQRTAAKGRGKVRAYERKNRNSAG